MSVILLERKVQEVDPNEHNYNANNFIEYLAAYSRLVLDLLAHSPPQES